MDGLARHEGRQRRVGLHRLAAGEDVEIRAGKGRPLDFPHPCLGAFGRGRAVAVHQQVVIDLLGGQLGAWDISPRGMAPPRPER